ncbi:MAG: hypothetical protein ABEI97_00620 [Candidatus Nanohaloarchaea archaeon]
MAVSVVGAIFAVNAVIWVYAAFTQLRIGHEIYGQRYTEAVPPTLAAYILFLLVQLVILSYFVFIGTQPPAAFLFSIQVLQILAGLFLVVSLAKIYGMDFATTGFMEVDDNE